MIEWTMASKRAFASPEGVMVATATIVAAMATTTMATAGSATATTASLGRCYTYPPILIFPYSLGTPAIRRDAGTQVTESGICWGCRCTGRCHCSCGCGCSHGCTNKSISCHGRLHIRATLEIRRLSHFQHLLKCIGKDGIGTGIGRGRHCILYERNGNLNGRAQHSSPLAGGRGSSIFRHYFHLHYQQHGEYVGNSCNIRS